MTTEANLPIVIDFKEYGLTNEKANSIALAFKPVIEEMTTLEDELIELNKLEQSKEKSKLAKALRLKYVKARTLTASIHKEEKEEFRKGGLYVDAWKNAQGNVSKKIEEGLKDIEEYEKRIEEARIAKIRHLRLEQLNPYSESQDQVWAETLFTCDDESFALMLGGIKSKFIQRQREKEAFEAMERETALRQEQERSRYELFNRYVFFATPAEEETDIMSYTETDFAKLIATLAERKSSFEADQAEMKRLQEEERIRQEEEERQKKAIESGGDIEAVKLTFTKLYDVLDRAKFKTPQITQLLQSKVKPYLQQYERAINSKLEK